MSKKRPPSDAKPSTGTSSASAPRRRPNGVDENGSRWMWPFELTERIGEGGMGVVYRGRYVPNGREVAVKMLPDDVQDAVILARFEQELEILKDLKHPNIVRCFGGVCENENRFYAMELVEGGSLEDDLKKRPKLPWEQVVEYGEQMAAGLQASHEKGIIHRDVKPGNFLKTSTGRLKLSDFGLARIDAGRKITRAGKTAGTVLYMAPEQIRGQDITPAADIYALGCVLYEMLTGRTPFEGDSAAALLHAHVMQPPPRLGQYATDCPVALEELVHEMLQKAAEDRPKSAAEIGTRLAGLSETAQITPRRRSTDLGGVSSRPTAVPDSRTKTLEQPTVATIDLKSSTALPKWSIISAAGAALVLLAGLVWQATTAASLRSYKTQLIASARQSGPDQEFALNTLAIAGPSDSDVVSTIVDMLKSSDAKSRQAAATAAAHLDSNEMSLIATLNRLAQKDPSDSVRYAAAQAVQKLGKE